MSAPTLRPGQLVECINDTPHGPLAPDEYTMDGLARGRIYTVRWVGMHQSDLHGRYRGLRLEEIFRKPEVPECEVDLPYRTSRFRPVESTRLNVFRAMLDQTPQKVREDAGS